MAITQKISVAMGRDELRLAKTAADEEGLSLSAFVTRAVRERLEERRRIEAARKVLSTLAPDDIPSARQQRDLGALWTRGRPRTARSRQEHWPQEHGAKKQRAARPAHG